MHPPVYLQHDTAPLLSLAAGPAARAGRDGLALGGDEANELVDSLVHVEIGLGARLEEADAGLRSKAGPVGRGHLNTNSVSKNSGKRPGERAASNLSLVVHVAFVPHEHHRDARALHLLDVRQQLNRLQERERLF